MVKYSEKGTVHPCPSLKNYAFYTAVLHRLFFTELAHRGRANGIQIDATSLYRSFVVRSALAQTCLPRFQYVFSNRERVLLP